MRPVRAIVISDLHLGGTPPCMMSQPSRLAAFIERLPQEVRQGEQLELVIAGDFIDFLAIPPNTDWSNAASAAREKMQITLKSGFEPIFNALAHHVQRGDWLTVLVGNHDVEMALPSIQTAFLRGIGAAQHQVLFVDDGCAHRIGGALIEHGNRYDGANFNDWSGLRAIASASSRNAATTTKLRVSAGSQIVEEIVNAIKPRYPFIDLIQPQGELAAYLLVALEPSLRSDWGKLRLALRGHRRQSVTEPARTENVAAAPKAVDAELAEAFGDLYLQLGQPGEEVGAKTQWLRLFATSRKDSLSEIIGRGEALPPDRLRQMQVALRRMLLDDRSAYPDGPTEQYGVHAREMLSGDIETVVMGHTHLARHIGPPDRATYINTGTWADVVRVPAAAGEGLDELANFLRGLVTGDIGRDFRPTYADLSIDADGHVTRAQLRSASP